MLKIKIPLIFIFLQTLYLSHSLKKFVTNLLLTVYVYSLLYVAILYRICGYIIPRPVLLQSYRSLLRNNQSRLFHRIRTTHPDHFLPVQYN